MRYYGIFVTILHLPLISGTFFSVEKFTESFLSLPLEHTVWFESFKCNYSIYIFYIYLENILQTWCLIISCTNLVKVPFPVLEDFILVNYQTNLWLVGLAHFMCMPNNMFKRLTLSGFVIRLSAKMICCNCYSETVREYEGQFHHRLEQERSQWNQYRENVEREIAELRRRLSEGQEEENLENEMKKVSQDRAVSQPWQLGGLQLSEFSSQHSIKNGTISFNYAAW